VKGGSVLLHHEIGYLSKTGVVSLRATKLSFPNVFIGNPGHFSKHTLNSLDSRFRGNDKKNRGNDEKIRGNDEKNRGNDEKIRGNFRASPRHS